MGEVRRPAFVLLVLLPRGQGGRASCYSLQNECPPALLGGISLNRPLLFERLKKLREQENIERNEKNIYTVGSHTGIGVNSHELKFLLSERGRDCGAFDYD